MSVFCGETFQLGYKSNMNYKSFNYPSTFFCHKVKTKYRNINDFFSFFFLHLAIENLQNHLIFEFFFKKFSFWRNFAQKKEGWHHHTHVPIRPLASCPAR
jgi:hypothetical protein